MMYDLGQNSVGVNSVAIVPGYYQFCRMNTQCFAVICCSQSETNACISEIYFFPIRYNFTNTP